jgi:hypothetical protein
MDTEERKSQLSDDQPGNNNPNDIDWKHPAKRIQQQEDIDRMDGSQLGIDTSRQPAQESSENKTFQIDEGTKEIQKQKKSEE